MKTTNHFKRTIQMVFGATCSGRCALCQEIPQPCQKHRRLRDLHSELCAEKRLQRLHGRGDIGQAVHYYDENEIEVGQPIQCQIAVNHVVELTAEEKAEARQNAIRQYQDGLMREMQNRHKPRTATKATT